MSQASAKILSAKDSRKGHRERLRQRLLTAGRTGLKDYELLELILFLAIPQRDVKPVAKSLLKEFKDLAGVISAPAEQLAEYAFIKDEAIFVFRLLEAITQQVTQERVSKKDVISGWRDLLAYCRTTLSNKQREEFHILYLNHKNQIIRDECVSEGTVNHTTVYPREVARRALLQNASAVILVHNHPSGDTTPSKADIEMTKQIKKVLAGLDIILHDHLIVARKTLEGEQDIVSFKNIGLL